MSYDYLLFPRPPVTLIGVALSVFARKLGKGFAVSNSLDGPPIGQLEEVKARISTVFEGIAWTKTTLPRRLAVSMSATSDWSWHSVGVPKIRLGLDSEGNVRLISVGSAEPREVKRLARHLGLSVIDEQSFD